ncbi:MAG: bifunctional UDP-N-acetylglucosamine diphosphorylase/glucosamine-1-phosphate N-acetyltransferase GlmU [Streptosporangiaceae bacterium]
MSDSRPAAVIILAAGEGTRMKSTLPKVLHRICGRSLLGHAIAAVGELGPRRVIVVAGHGRDQVAAETREYAPDADVVIQDQQLGTGHAVRMVIESLGVISGTVIVTYADMPLVRASTYRELADAHEAAGNAVTVLTADGDSEGYGRIVRDASGQFEAIVEQRDASPRQRRITEYNSGCYAFDGDLLADAIKRVTSDNDQQQEYLTDVVAITRGDGHRVGTVLAADSGEVLGVNDRVQLGTARRVLNERLAISFMQNGVTIVDPATTWFDATVTIGRDSEIGPGTQLEGRTAIGQGVRIGPGCTLTDTTVGDGARLRQTVADHAEVGSDVTVGPYAYLRPGTQIADRAHIGCHVELKNAVVGEGAKVPHLTYVGDADIGTGANIGAGTIFANYDGMRKHHTTVGEHAFVGSDSVLIAPVTIGDGAYTAAGSAIDQDVAPGALGVARGRQHNSDGWVLRKREGTASAEAAGRVVMDEER